MRDCVHQHKYGCILAWQKKKKIGVHLLVSKTKIKFISVSFELVALANRHIYFLPKFHKKNVEQNRNIFYALKIPYREIFSEFHLNRAGEKS